jgi:chromosomal replication initiation ATPase DnaA
MKEIASVIFRVCEFYNVELEQLFNYRYKGKPTNARYIVIYRLHTELGYSLSRLSKMFGITIRRISTANEVIKHRLKFEPKFREEYNLIFEGDSFLAI